jgi:outer membrane lipoprotein-sorting protein
MITIAFKSNDVKENIKEKKFWLKKPRLPNARIIFLDKNNKPCVSPRKYVWFGGKFKEHTNNWELLRKVFQTPANADNISLTLFFNAQGNYWIDKITIEEL